MKKQNVLNKKKKGFTLIELIIVIAILAVLAVMVIPKFMGFQESAKKRHDVSDARNIANVTSTLLAEDKLSTNISGVLETAVDTNMDKIEAMIQNGIPEIKTTDHSGEKFEVKVDTDGNVKVYSTDGTNEYELYPNTHTDFK